MNTEQSLLECILTNSMTPANAFIQEVLGAEYDRGCSVLDVQHIFMATLRALLVTHRQTMEQHALWYGLVDIQTAWLEWWKNRLADSTTRWGALPSHLGLYSHDTVQYVMGQHIEDGAPHVSASVATAFSLYTWALITGYHAQEPFWELLKYVPPAIRTGIQYAGNYAKTGQHIPLPAPPHDPLVQTYATLPVLHMLPAEPTHMDRIRLALLWFDTALHHGRGRIIPLELDDSGLTC